MTIEDRLQALAAGPKPFRCVTTYACGKSRYLDCHSEAAANNHADGERRKIGRELIERETGRTVVVTSVDVVRKGGLN